MEQDTIPIEEKSNKSLRFGVIAIVSSIILTILHEELHFLRTSNGWFTFLLFFPAMIIAAFGLVYGIESLRSSKIESTCWGILSSLIALIAIGFELMFLLFWSHFA
jgi:cation transport ATPase